MSLAYRLLKSHFVLTLNQGKENLYVIKEGNILHSSAALLK